MLCIYWGWPDSWLIEAHNWDIPARDLCCVSYPLSLPSFTICHQIQDKMLTNIQLLLNLTLETVNPSLIYIVCVSLCQSCQYSVDKLYFQWHGCCIFTAIITFQLEDWIIIYIQYLFYLVFCYFSYQVYQSRWCFYLHLY